MPRKPKQNSPPTEPPPVEAEAPETAPPEAEPAATEKAGYNRHMGVYAPFENHILIHVVAPMLQHFVTTSTFESKAHLRREFNKAYRCDIPTQRFDEWLEVAGIRVSIQVSFEIDQRHLPEQEEPQGMPPSAAPRGEPPRAGPPLTEDELIRKANFARDPRIGADPGRDMFGRLGGKPPPPANPFTPPFPR